jgi:UDP-glucose 4-epimerase
MKILITGGLGYIGSHVTVELLKKNHQVLIIDNLSNSDFSVLNQIKKITKITPDFEKVDLVNRNDTSSFFNRHKD